MRIVVTTFAAFVICFATATQGEDTVPPQENVQILDSDLATDDYQGLFVIEEDQESVAASNEATDGEKVLPAYETRGKTLREIFREANEAYEADELEEAGAHYEVMIAKGAANGAVYFNLGNTYFRMGDFGRAILCYEKAKKVSPRDPDIVHNLTHVKSYLVDREAGKRAAPRALESLLVLHYQTTENETLWMLACLTCLLGVIFILRLLRMPFTEKVFYGYVRGAVVLLFVLQLISAVYKIEVETKQREGVILIDSVRATASPGAEELLAEVNAGTKVEILDIRNGYAHIRLPTGTPAFVQEDEIGEV